jgi:uncharacterized lipoprotein YmbA
MRNDEMSHNMSRLFPAFIAVLAVLLASCASSPPVHYYSLEPLLVTKTVDGPGSTMVGMGPMRLPEYLKRSRMVTRTAGAEIKVHEQARWAEPVDKAIHRVLAASVDSQLDDVIVVAYPYMETVPMDYMVLGQVVRFDSDQDGNVLLAVQWAVLDEKRKALIAPQRVRYETHAGDPNEPDQIARAMNEALNQFGRDIAGQLRESLGRD